MIDDLVDVDDASLRAAQRTVRARRAARDPKDAQTAAAAAIFSSDFAEAMPTAPLDVIGWTILHAGWAMMQIAAGELVRNRNGARQCCRGTRFDDALHLVWIGDILLEVAGVGEPL